MVDFQAAVQTIADVYGLAAGDVEIVLQAVSRGDKSRAKWVSLCRLANAGHSHTVTIDFQRGCITSTKTVTTVEALERTLGGGDDQ